MRIAVVSFADDRTERYELGIVRLKHSLKHWMSEADFLGFRTFQEINSPTHLETPYAFKAYAIQEARNRGYDIILWCDSVVYAIKDLKPIFNYIKENNYVFFDNTGYSIADYTSDKCLDIMDMTREEAKKLPMIMACCMGFNLQDPQVNRLLDKYVEHATTGAYEGNWFNNNNEVSLDPECKGHRHDQSVISILIQKEGLEVIKGNETFFAYADNPNLPISESVSLISK